MPVDRKTILGRGLAGRCPNCGNRDLFATRFRMRERCPHCNMRLERGEGFFLGAMVINYGVVVFGVLPLLLIGWGLGVMSVPMIWILGAVAAIVLPVLVYRFSRTAWLGTYFAVLPQELPSNAAEDTPL